MNLKPYSASHIKLWKTCNRREAFAYRTDLPREIAGDAAQAGNVTHNLLETGEFNGAETYKHYKTGAMAQLLQAATPVDVVSREAEVYKEVGGLSFMGRVDFQTPRAVGDYKTTSSPRGIRTVAELEDDPQRLMYVELTGKPDSIWLYGNFRTMKVTPVVVPGDAARDSEKFKLHVLTPAEEMSLVPMDVDPLSLEPNTLSCGLYPPAGCPYASRCYSVDGSLRSSVAHNQTVAHIDSESSASANAEQATPEEVEVSVLDMYRDAPAKPVAVDDGKLIGTLYVDAYPVQGVASVKHAGELIAAASKSVCDDAHVLHSQLVDFGKGAHMLAAQLKHDIKTAGTFYENLYLETRSAEGKAVLFELTQMARVVCRGMI